MDFVNSVYESISIYRSIAVCHSEQEMMNVESCMKNHDYHVTRHQNDKNARVLLLKHDEFSKYMEFFDSNTNASCKDDYTVIFISKSLHDRVDLSKVCSIFQNVKLVAFLEIQI